jgi:hypothetical protein
MESIVILELLIEPPRAHARGGMVTFSPIGEIRASTRARARGTAEVERNFSTIVEMSLRTHAREGPFSFSFLKS